MQSQTDGREKADARLVNVTTQLNKQSQSQGQGLKKD
jgi:hypothetical protein